MTYLTYYIDLLEYLPPVSAEFVQGSHYMCVFILERVRVQILKIKHTRFITWLSQLMAAGEERENPGD